MGAFERLADSVKALAASAVRFEQGIVTSDSPLTVEGVDGDVELRALGWYDPTIGDAVIVARWGNTAVVLGAQTFNQTPALTGTVTGFTSGASTASVSVGGTVYTLQKLKTYTPVVGDITAILWRPYTDAATGTVKWNGVMVGAVGATPAATTPTKVYTPPVATETVVVAPVTTTGTTTITASSNGTWRSGSWRTDTPKVVAGVWNGRTNSGFWFYGTKLKALSSSNGYTIKKAWVYLHASSGGAYAATGVDLAWHSGKTKGSANPDAGSSFASPSLADGESGWYEIPVAEAQKIVNGTTYYGLAALPSSAYTTLLGITGSSSVAKDIKSGALRFQWERTV